VEPVSNAKMARFDGIQKMSKEKNRTKKIPKKNHKYTLRLCEPFTKISKVMAGHMQLLEKEMELAQQEKETEMKFEEYEMEIRTLKDQKLELEEGCRQRDEEIVAMREGFIGMNNSESTYLY
jgi:hypothetical protein